MPLAQRALLRIALGAATLYVVTLVLAPLLRPDLDVLRTYPEHYANGPTDALVRLGYASIALMALAIAAAFAASAGIGGAAAASLIAGGVMAAVLAAVPQEVSGGFLAVGVLGLVAGPPLMTLALRARLTRHRAFVAAFAAAEVIAFVALALLPREIGGIVNRAFDALLGCWGIALALSALRSG